MAVLDLINRVNQEAMELARHVADQQRLQDSAAQQQQQQTTAHNQPRDFNRNLAEGFGIDPNLVRGLFNLRTGAVNPSQSCPSSPNAAQIQQIAQENAPILVLPSQENLPADPQEFIDNSELRENVPLHAELPDLSFWDGSFDPTPVGYEDQSLGNNINDDSGDDFTAVTLAGVTNDNTFLDLDNDMRGQLGRTDAPVFYQFQNAEYDANGAMTKPPRLTYHIFYAYNDAPKGGLTADTKVVDFNHEGDWERVTYELDPTTFEPDNALLSAHTGGAATEFGRLDRDATTGRPLIYVADGSHANYNAPGTESLQFNALDQTAVDENGDGRIDQADGAIFFDTAVNLNEVTSQAWYPTSGGGVRWGEIGALSNTPNDVAEGVVGENIDHSSGPQGPSEDKGAVEP